MTVPDGLIPDKLKVPDGASSPRGYLPNVDLLSMPARRVASQ
jgi:hypothetical protein